ncbi:MAG: AbiV family abortive infection protein [Bacteroidetes bacterium]|nr:MAG: AbiV family abortive infection protein [Bacteroidota bacterium]
MAKKFSSLTKAECSEAYQQIFATAESEWQAALELAATGKYGNATSLMIISIEEYVKSLLIFFDSHGFHFRTTKGVSIFFKNHQIRYVIAFVMAVMNLFGEEMKRFLLRVKENPEEIRTLHSAFKEDDNYFEKKFGYYFRRKLVEIMREFRWFKGADLFRQEGFYCDYKDFLKTPLNVTEDEFKEVFKRLKKVRSIGKAIIAGFESDSSEIRDQLQKMKTEFRAKNHYLKITNGLKKLSESKQSPFEFIEAQIGKDM